MKAKHLFTIILILLVFSASSISASSGSSLGEARAQMQDLAGMTDDARQKKCLSNADDSAKSAEEAEKQGDKKAAKKHRRNALKWIVQAVRECMDPKKIPESVIEALRQQGAMDDHALKQFRENLAMLVAAKEARKKSDFPFFHDLAMNQLILALNEVIDGGGGAFHPQDALDIYINAAAGCEDVQDQINRILEYLNKNSDRTGITDLSDADYAEAKRMLDELFAKKRAGAPPDEIIELAEKIKKFLDDAGARTGAARLAKERRELAEEEEKRISAKPAAVTTVAFTALDGKTNINKSFLGEVQQIQFVAEDDKEIDPREVAPDIVTHSDSFTVTIGKAAKIAGIVITGTEGIVRLLQDRTGRASPGQTGIRPKDGTIDIRNGTLNETFNVTRGTPDMTLAPQDHTVRVGSADTTVVATRPDQVAVVASGIPAATTGTLPVSMTTPSGAVITDNAPAWGYNITMPALTKTNVWVEITAVVYGVDPFETITFTFMPGPGQQITPLEVSMPAAQAAAPAPVARIMTEQPGPQSLNVLVTRKGL